MGGGAPCLPIKGVRKVIQRNKENPGIWGKLKSKLKSEKFLFEVTPSIFRSYLFVIGVAIILLFLVHTRWVIQELRVNARETVKSHVTLLSTVGASGSEQAEHAALSASFNLIEKFDFPMIITMDIGEIKVIDSWNKIPDIPHPHSSKINIKEYIRDIKPELLKMAQEMDKINEPITFEPVPGKYLTIHYGDPPAVNRLWWVPFLEIAAIFLFIVIGFIGFHNIKNSEQRYIWTGMAKETAHQLGTPLSSLSGWLELMKSELHEYTGRERRDNSRSLQSKIDEMEDDLKRLNKVASRFGQIGSVPELKSGNVEDVICETISYFQHRLPQIGRKVEIVENFGGVPEVIINGQLLGWVFENLIKNSMDAIDNANGKIEIRTYFKEGGKWIQIDIQDNGRGINVQDQKKIFLPGYSTKGRGWGLGMTFVKRIVEDYHKGKIFIKESAPGLGTTVRVMLPVGDYVQGRSLEAINGSQKDPTEGHRRLQTVRE